MVVAAEAAAHLEASDSDGQLRLVPRGEWTLASASALETRSASQASLLTGRFLISSLCFRFHLGTAEVQLAARTRRDQCLDGGKDSHSGG